MTTTNHTRNRRSAGAIALAMAAAALLPGCSNSGSDSFRLAVAADDLVKKETKQFAADRAAEVTEGGPAVAASAFAACLQPLSFPSGESDLNRCEVEGVQLAVSRGFDGAAASSVVNAIRLQVAAYAAERREHYDARMQALKDKS